MIQAKNNLILIRFTIQIIIIYKSGEGPLEHRKDLLNLKRDPLGTREGPLELREGPLERREGPLKPGVPSRSKKEPS